MNVAYPAAFLAGLFSIASPCVFPLVPVYLGYLAGAGVPDRPQGRLLWNAVLFVLGFSSLFVALGTAASALGSFLSGRIGLLEHVGGLVIIAFGLVLLGVLDIPALRRTVQGTAPRRLGPFGALLLGLAFAAGWTPCVGPILAAILVLAGTTRDALHGAILLAVYSAGLGIPFLAMAALSGFILPGLRRIRPYLPWAERAGGVLLVALGVVMGTGLFGRLVGAGG